MKRILFLLLLTVSVYGQNPSRFAKIQITGNANSGTATKVNVQEANGEVNTQTINTGFNKNIGLNSGDVVGATTLLNQYSTTPIDWTATTFASGQVVFYGGKQWIAKMATVAGDVPAVSSKWEEITFEALANKTTTVDQTIIDGSTNAVSSNAVFDGLAGKANLSGGNTFIGNQILPSSELQVGVSATNSSIIYFRSGGITAYGNGSTTNKSFELSQGAESQGGFSLGTNTVKMYMREGGLAGYSTPIRFNNPITSTGYVKEGGLASQFLKADGTVDSNSYALSSSTHNPLTLGTANGLSLSNQQISLGLASSGVTGALSGTDWNTFNGKFNTPTGLTTNYLPKWNGSGLGNSGIFDNGTNVGVNETAFNLYGFGNFGGGVTSNLKFAVSDAAYVNGFASVTNGSKLVFGYRSQFGSPDEMASIQMIAESIANNNEVSSLRFFTKSGVVSTIAEEKMRITPSGRILINKTDDDLTNQLQVAGTISASPATTANQVVVKSQLDAVAARPYKVYTALLTQTGTNAPTATVLENTLGGNVVWSRSGVGTYTGTLTGAFVTNKTIGFQGGNLTAPNSMVRITTGINNIQITTNTSTATADNLLGFTSIEIRVYN